MDYCMILLISNTQTNITWILIRSYTTNMYEETNHPLAPYIMAVWKGSGLYEWYHVDISNMFCRVLCSWKTINYVCWQIGSWESIFNTYTFATFPSQITPLQLPMLQESILPKAKLILAKYVGQIALLQDCIEYCPSNSSL